MIVRQRYLDRLMRFRDRDLIKVVTGVRRCGKSTLLDMAREHLRAEGVPEGRLLEFKMESMEFDGIGDYRDLYAIVRERAEGVERPYLFFDELQQVEGWERAVNSLRVDLDCDIYVTGSNAYLLSSELSTMISGRYVEVEMLPLTFAEYLDFRGAEWFPAGGPQADLVRLRDGSYGTLSAMLDQYRRYGGLPFLALSEPDAAEHRAYLKSLHDTVIVRDILERDRRRGARRLTNPDLLRRLCSFLADNVGNENSTNSIAGTIRAEGARVANETVDAYVSALCDAYLFYPVRRYDIKGRELLKTGGKHYVVDPGLRSYLQGYRDADQGRVFENIVYLQLLYDGWDVSVGKLRSGEVDFVATRGPERVYVQVTEDMTDPGTMARELAPLRAVRDAYPKMVVAMRGSYPTDVDGIRILSAADFLLHRA
ncbi:ATP-binding protein [Thermophilibacter sp. ET337]|uniref:ATP-binding protein n=1 Tax=Thermophilibacter sp. ET337 TaxID=2973084 RepID=UPI0021AC1DCF|nr:ATP-binding protein [Thermophilibacter sp. ET337]MCR8908838.1 ATP-binding protein [Thermophilibacter sp. ET337]